MRSTDLDLSGAEGMWSDLLPNSKSGFDLGLAECTKSNLFPKLELDLGLSDSLALFSITSKDGSFALGLRAKKSL
jgi:hypothetical protein